MDIISCPGIFSIFRKKKFNAHDMQITLKKKVGKIEKLSGEEMFTMIW